MLVGYIRQLKERGHQIALLSNDSPALLGKLQKLEIDGLFDPLIVSAFIGVMKPDAPRTRLRYGNLGAHLNTQCLWMICPPILWVPPCCFVRLPLGVISHTNMSGWRVSVDIHNSVSLIFACTSAGNDVICTRK